MTNSEDLTARVRRTLAAHSPTESPFLDGSSFWVDDRLIVSIHEGDLLVRVPKDDYPDLLDRPGVGPYEFAARPVPAWVVVEGASLDGDERLAEWVEIALTGPRPD